MRSHVSRLFSLLALVACVTAGIVAIGAATGPAYAAAADYTFTAVSERVDAGDGAVIAVRLTDEKTGKPVENAVIFQTSVDMGPDGMGGMTAPVTPLGQSEPGVYRFKTDLSMAGRWALHLAAKVPGEQETVRGTVVVAAD